MAKLAINGNSSSVLPRQKGLAGKVKNLDARCDAVNAAVLAALVAAHAASADMLTGHGRKPDCTASLAVKCFLLVARGTTQEANQPETTNRKLRW